MRHTLGVNIQDFHDLGVQAAMVMRELCRLWLEMRGPGFKSWSSWFVIIYLILLHIPGTQVAYGMEKNPNNYIFLVKIKIIKPDP